MKRIQKYEYTEVELLGPELIEFDIQINAKPKLKLKLWQRALNLIYPFFKPMPIEDIIRDNIVLTCDLGNEQAIKSVEPLNEKGLYRVVVLNEPFTKGSITIM